MFFKNFETCVLIMNVHVVATLLITFQHKFINFAVIRTKFGYHSDYCMLKDIATRPIPLTVLQFSSNPLFI